MSQSGKLRSQPSGGIYRRLSFSSRKTNRTSFLAVKASARLSVEGFSFERLPESYAGMDARALRAEAGVMRDVAGSISADMNRLFAAQEKAQKNRDNAAR